MTRKTDRRAADGLQPIRPMRRDRAGLNKSSRTGQEHSNHADGKSLHGNRPPEVAPIVTAATQNILAIRSPRTQVHRDSNLYLERNGEPADDQHGDGVSHSNSIGSSALQLNRGARNNHSNLNPLFLYDGYHQLVIRKELEQSVDNSALHGMRNPVYILLGVNHRYVVRESRLEMNLTPSDLPNMTRRDFESLLGGLGSDDPTVQNVARAALERVCHLKWPRSYMLGTEVGGYLDAQAAYLHDSVAVSCLLDALRHGHPRARVFAAHVLWVARERTAIPLLIDCLNAEQKEVRAASAGALGHLPDSCAVEPLIRLLGDVDLDVRAAAAASLGKLGDDRAVSALSALLRSKHWRDRQSGLYGLGKLLRPLYGHAARPPAHTATEALPAIRCALADPNQRVRKAAKSALSRYDWNRRQSTRERNTER